MRLVSVIAVSLSLLSAPLAADESWTIVHAGHLLSVPGQAPKANQSLVIKGGVIEEIRNGQFAREWILENRAGAPAFKALRRRDRGIELEQVGRRLRSLMSWIDSKEV